jgi:hypothetical protein
MKHVHFTPLAPKKSKVANTSKTKSRPEDIPLPSSRSCSPEPPEKYGKREKRISLSEQKGYKDHNSSNVCLTLNESMSGSSSHESETETTRTQTRISPTRTAKRRPSNTWEVDAGNKSLSLQRSHSLESSCMGPPSTVLVSSEEPPNIFSRKGKERDTDDCSFEKTNNLDLSEDKIRIQLLEAEVERLRSEVCLSTHIHTPQLI